MEAKTFTVINPGNVTTAGNAVWFYVPGTTTPTPVYGSNVVGTPLSQPVLTNANGQVTVWAPNGNHDVALYGSLGTLLDTLPSVEFFDVLDVVGLITGAANVGSGVGIYASAALSLLQFKSLIAGTGASIVDNGNGSITISLVSGSGSGTVTSAASDGSGTAIYNSATSTSSTLRFKSLKAGANISVSDDGNGTVTIASSNPGGTVTGAASEGFGTAVYDLTNSTAQTLKFKSLAAGSNMTITDNGLGTLTLASTGGASSVWPPSVPSLYDLPAGQTLTVPPGFNLLFLLSSGLSIEGDLIVQGDVVQLDDTDPL